MSPENSLLNERVVEITQQLIRFNTTNYGVGQSEGEHEAAAYVVEILRGMGLDPVTIESAPTRANVIARVEGEDLSLPALIVHGHLDVVPAIAEDWKYPPFSGEIAEGCIWGRGAVDMKNTVAMYLAAMEQILSSGKKPRRTILLAFFADEESGGTYGAQYLVQHHPELFAGASEAISEVGGYSVALSSGQRSYLLQTGEKAILWLKLFVPGTPGHGSRINNNNAVTKLAQALIRITEAQWPVQLTATTQALLTALARLHNLDPETAELDELLALTGLARQFIAPTFRNTVNPTGLSAGYKHNVIPGEAEAWLDIRTLPGEEEAVKKTIQELAGSEIRVEVVLQDIGFETKFSGPLVDTITAILLEHDPEAVVLPYLLAGGTDNKSLSKLGITGYGFAPLKLPADLDFGALFHGTDERVPLEALVFGKNVMIDLLLRY